MHAGIPPPQTRQTPPRPGRHPRGLDTHPRIRHPPGPGRPPPRPGRSPPGKQTPTYGLRAAGTHPTGMHSCYLKICKFLKIALRCNSVDKLISVWTSGYQKSLVHLTNASNSSPQEWIPVGHVPPAVYRTAGGRVSVQEGGLCPVRGVSDQGGGSLSGRQTPLLPVDRQTPVKLLPCPKLCLRAIKISGIAVVSCLRCMTTVKSLTNPSVLRRICL